MSTHEVDRDHTALEDNGGRERTMRHRCHECGEHNRILPPLGYRLVQSGRMAEAEDAAQYFARVYGGNADLIQVKESHSAGGEDAADFFERVYYHAG